MLVGVWLCMRESEITALTWDCVDFKKKAITIKKALVRDKDDNWVEKSTKTTSSTRTINVSDYIMDKLEAAKAQATDDRGVPLTGPGLYRRFKTILRKNGLPDIRFHDGCIKIGLNQKQPHSKGGTDLVLFLFYNHKGGNK